MTLELNNFIELDQSFKFKAKIGSIKLANVKGKGTAAVENTTGIKYISMFYLHLKSVKGY